MWPFPKKKKQEKVYCSECKYILVKNQDQNFCRNKYTSINTYDKDTPLKRGTGELLTTEPRRCEDLNDKNDCFWFKPRDTKNDT